MTAKNASLVIESLPMRGGNGSSQGRFRLLRGKNQLLAMGTQCAGFSPKVYTYEEYRFPGRFWLPRTFSPFTASPSCGVALLARKLRDSFPLTKLCLGVPRKLGGLVKRRRAVGALVGIALNALFDCEE
jgi:hypothetical protein